MGLRAANHKTEDIAKTTAKAIEENWIDKKIRLSGEGFEVVFDAKDGSIYSLS